ncbi:FlgO family outer membrane protein [Alteromonas sp. ASW11-19]|uniref:FlgO family outer membrane protein n=1 Tax=Alteromonas salexigens TaxID=2982530 RepID=A0ABT2VUP4_9ALTE|nr:FlgO family outer membrane protein [Alteromonas salexigens]MCU7555941.1 FlgO family outer membrane protein [Alteromonas salexigens]
MRCRLIPIVSVLLMTSGCSSSGWPGSGSGSGAPVTHVPADSGLEYRPDSRDRETQERSQAETGYRDPLQSGFSPSQTHKKLNDYAGQLAMLLMDSATRLTQQDLVGVASFVRLNRSLQETTVLGNQLSEYLIAELQTFGLSVVDFKLANGVSVTPYGDLALSRDGAELASKVAMDHIVTGTIIEDPRGVRVNARIIAVDNRQVVASANIYIPAFIVSSLNHAGAVAR